MAKEIWALEINKGEGGAGNFVLAMDRAGDPFLAYGSWADANKGAEAHLKNWDIKCTPKFLVKIGDVK